MRRICSESVYAFYGKEKNVGYGAKAAGTETRPQGYPSVWEKYYCNLAVCLPIAVLAMQWFRL